MPERPFSIGVDVVSIQRIRRMIVDHPEKFPNLAFSHQEQRYCERQARPAQHYAGRWTIKEAFIKALPDRNPNIDLTSIEVKRTYGIHIEIDNEAHNLINQISAIDISMAHDEIADIAIGIVLIEF